MIHGLIATYLTLPESSEAMAGHVTHETPRKIQNILHYFSGSRVLVTRIIFVTLNVSKNCGEFWFLSEHESANRVYWYSNVVFVIASGGSRISQRGVRQPQRRFCQLII